MLWRVSIHQRDQLKEIKERRNTSNNFLTTLWMQVSVLNFLIKIIEYNKHYYEKKLFTLIILCILRRLLTVVVANIVESHFL